MHIYVFGAGYVFKQEYPLCLCAVAETDPPLGLTPIIVPEILKYLH